MNLYFLVEGGETEPKVYPKWIGHLCPSLTRKELPFQVVSDDYCLQSGYGYPKMLYNYLGNAIEDLNQLGVFDFLIICLDSDGRAVSEVEEEVQEFMRVQKLKPQGYEIKIIVQNVAIETWFLGNSKIFRRNSESADFRACIQHYDVSTKDPERMPIMDPYVNLSEFHYDYLRLLLAERNMRYTKTHPRAVTDPDYLQQLILRTQETDHLASLRDFLQFIRKVNS
jgi:hypothetical protein